MYDIFVIYCSIVELYSFNNYYKQRNKITQKLRHLECKSTKNIIIVRYSVGY